MLYRLVQIKVLNRGFTCDTDQIFPRLSKKKRKSDSVQIDPSRFTHLFINYSCGFSMSHPHFLLDLKLGQQFKNNILTHKSQAPALAVRSSDLSHKRRKTLPRCGPCVDTTTEWPRVDMAPVLDLSAVIQSLPECKDNKKPLQSVKLPVINGMNACRDSSIQPRRQKTGCDNSERKELKDGTGNFFFFNDHQCKLSWFYETNRILKIR